MRCADLGGCGLGGCCSRQARVCKDRVLARCRTCRTSLTARPGPTPGRRDIHGRASRRNVMVVPLQVELCTIYCLLAFNLCTHNSVNILFPPRIPNPPQMAVPLDKCFSRAPKGRKEKDEVGGGGGSMCGGAARQARKGRTSDAPSGAIPVQLRPCISCASGGGSPPLASPDGARSHCGAPFPRPVAMLASYSRGQSG